MTRRWLIGIESVTGTSAAIGGALLIARPDGHLVGAHTSALAGSPFDTWLVPGILLMTLVGGGFLVAAGSLWTAHPLAPAVSIVAGLGLVGFEIFEVAWLGIQPLELIFMAVGVVVAGLGTRLLRQR